MIRVISNKVIKESGNVSNKAIRGEQPTLKG